MCSDTSDEIKLKFELVAKRREAETLKRPTDWDTANEIKSRYKNETRAVKQKYYDEYDSRAETRLKTLIDKAGAKTKDHKLRLFGADNFNRHNLKRQAHREVHHDHARRLASIEDRENTELGAFLDTCRERNQLREKPKRDFKQTADRRKDQPAPTSPNRRRDR